MPGHCYSHTCVCMLVHVHVCMYTPEYCHASWRQSPTCVHVHTCNLTVCDHMWINHVCLCTLLFPIILLWEILSASLGQAKSLLQVCVCCSYPYIWLVLVKIQFIQFVHVCIYMYTFTHMDFICILVLSPHFLQNGRSALYLASQEGSVGVVQALLDGGANTDLQDNVIFYNCSVCTYMYM